MTQYLANIKLSNTNCLTKKYRVPFFEYVLKDQTVVKYMARSTRYKDYLNIIYKVLLLFLYRLFYTSHIVK